MQLRANPQNFRPPLMVLDSFWFTNVVSTFLLKCFSAFCWTRAFQIVRPRQRSRFFDAEKRIVDCPAIASTVFWLVYFDSRSRLIFFWFVFGPHLWKCSQSSADWVLCWREVESRIDDNQKSLWDLLSSQIWRFCRVWSYKRREISVASYYGEVFCIIYILVRLLTKIYVKEKKNSIWKRIWTWDFHVQSGAMNRGL